MYQDEWIEEIILENRQLRRENYNLQIQLQEAEKKHYDFVDEMFRNAQGITESWINALLSKDLEINTN